MFTCLFAENLQFAVKKHFKNPIFTRISNDTLGIIFQKGSKEELNTFFKDFFQTTRDLGWKLEQLKLEITLQGCLIHRTRSKTGKSDDLMLQMEKLLNLTRADELLVEDFEQVADEGRTAKRVDILDFIAYDWQERNKDLEQAFKEILGVNRRLDQLSRGALTALARAIDAKSKWTAGHSERVTQLALKLGRALGLKELQMEKLYYGGLLHDIGKIGTPADLLNKKGRLSDHEYQVVREHPNIGKRILEPIDAFADLLPIVKHHHEHFDGTGYPDGLAGDDIDFSARIVAVADVFDALSSERPYRAGMPADKVFQIIKQNSGSHFDPLVVDALAGVLEQDKKLPKNRHPHSALFVNPIAGTSGIAPSGKSSPI
jgi:putative nucleotidyltransferase with HDIG domain